MHSQSQNDFLTPVSEDSDDDMTVLVDPPKIASTDVNNTALTMPAIMKCKTTTSGGNKKSTRVWNLYHYCFFCSYSGSNISRHLRAKHGDQEEIKEIVNCGRDKKYVQQRLELLRMKGDHLHNLKVMQEQDGVVVIARRKQNMEFDIEQYGPCPECYSWLFMKELDRHQKEKCLALKTKQIPIQTSYVNLEIHSKLLKGIKLPDYEVHQSF